VISILHTTHSHLPRDPAYLPVIICHCGIYTIVEWKTFHFTDHAAVLYTRMYNTLRCSRTTYIIIYCDSTIKVGYLVAIESPFEQVLFICDNHNTLINIKGRVWWSQKINVTLRVNCESILHIMWSYKKQVKWARGGSHHVGSRATTNDDRFMIMWPYKTKWNRDYFPTEFRDSYFPFYFSTLTPYVLWTLSFSCFVASKVSLFWDS